MIRRFLITSALLLASCGPKTLTLPEQPVERAATCGVVAADSARLATRDIQAPLSSTRWVISFIIRCWLGPPEEAFLLTKLRRCKPA